MFMFEKPLGMRDILPSLYEARKKVSSNMSDVMESWGYQFIETPTLEYFETVGSASSILDQQLFKLLDQQGHTLVLRPDMTSPIARVAASKLYQDGCPLRLAYTANVFRAQQREGGRPAEFEQIGIEYIGDQTISADAEVIALLIETLKIAGLTNFTVPIGHIGYVNALFLEVLGNQERANVLRRFLYDKNYVGYREHVNGLQLSSIDKQKLLSLLQLRGDISKITLARELIDSEDGRKAADGLHQLWQRLDVMGVTEFIKVDFNLVSHMNYYTGILFEVYAENIGYLLGNGGRYDTLLGKFERPAPATGFGLRLDHLIEALKLPDKEIAIQCVIFSSEQSEEAIEFARIRREQGERVILQDINGIANMDKYMNTFKDVTFFIGNTRKVAK